MVHGRVKMANKPPVAHGMGVSGQPGGTGFRMSILGGPSIRLGFHGKLGAWLLVLFLVPVTFTMHNFRAVKDLITDP